MRGGRSVHDFWLSICATGLIVSAVVYKKNHSDSQRKENIWMNR